MTSKLMRELIIQFNVRTARELAIAYRLYKEVKYASI